MTVPTRAGAVGPPGFPGSRTWVPRFVALVCLLVGLSDVLVLVAPGFGSRLRVVESWFPGPIRDSAGAGTLVIGILLILLAHGLSRRKRRAWRAVVALLSLSVLLHLFGGADIPATAVAIAFLVILVYYRGEFFALGDPRTRWTAVWVFAGLLLTDLVVGYFVVDDRVDAQRVHVNTLGELQQVVYGLVGVTGPTPIPDRSSDLVFALLLGLGVVTLVVTAYLALRPGEPPGRLDPADESRLRELLATQGCADSLGYFGLRRDKSVVWSNSGKAAITYRVVSGVMLASGDPHGDAEAWPGAISEFLTIAALHAWVPAVVGCSERGAEVWRREGDLQALEIGDEAILEVGEFALDGRPMRNVRQTVRRVERAGYVTTVRAVDDIVPAERSALSGQAAAWRAAETERGFSMALGRFGDPADRGCVIVTASEAGVLRAFLHFVPWGSNGWSLDLMRRDADAAPGVNEAMVVAAMAAAPSFGVERVSLNFAAFRAALERGERIGAGPVSRAWRGVLVFLSRWFQIESLYRFNAKFRPEWVPRFVVYPEGRYLPRVCAAALEAEAFIVMPSLRRSLNRRGVPAEAATAPVPAAPGPPAPRVLP